ncbi:MAG: hypothetical protein SGPRY_011776, partial [Prymnesium sp.]
VRAIRSCAHSESVPQSPILAPKPLPLSASEPCTPIKPLDAQTCRPDEPALSQSQLKLELRRTQMQCESLQKWVERQASLRAQAEMALRTELEQTRSALSSTQRELRAAEARALEARATDAILLRLEHRLADAEGQVVRLVCEQLVSTAVARAEGAAALVACEQKLALAELSAQGGGVLSTPTTMRQGTRQSLSAASERRALDETESSCGAADVSVESTRSSLDPGGGATGEREEQTTSEPSKEKRDKPDKIVSWVNSAGPSPHDPCCSEGLACEVPSPEGDISSWYSKAAAMMAAARAKADAEAEKMPNSSPMANLEYFSQFAGSPSFSPVESPADRGFQWLGRAKSPLASTARGGRGVGFGGEGKSSLSLSEVCENIKKELTTVRDPSASETGESLQNEMSAQRVRAASESVGREERMQQVQASVQGSPAYAQRSSAECSFISAELSPPPEGSFDSRLMAETRQSACCGALLPSNRGLQSHRTGPTKQSAREKNFSRGVSKVKTVPPLLPLSADGRNAAVSVQSTKRPQSLAFGSTRSRGRFG